MPMRTRWRKWAMLVRWAVVLSVLAAVGAVLYVMLPPEPRWQYDDEPLTVLDAGDGRIAVYQPGPEASAGPVRVLDAATGAEVARYLSETDTFTDSAQSTDGRTFVALVKGPQPNTWRICGIDFKQQREWQIDAPAGVIRSAVFSPRCDFVALQLGSIDAHAIVETATGRAVARVQLPCRALWVECAADDGCAVFGYSDEKGINHIHAVSTRTGKTKRFKDGQVVGVAPDSYCVIADRGAQGVWVGELATGAWLCRLEGTDNQRGFLDGRGVLHGDALIDLQTDILIRRRRTAFRVDGFSFIGRARRGLWIDGLNILTVAKPLFAPDARHVFGRGTATRAGRCAARYDLHTGKQRWRRDAPITVDDMSFTPDSRRVVAGRLDAICVDVLDAATGETEQTIALPGLTAAEPRLTRDGRTLIVASSPVDHEPNWLLAKMLEWLPKRPETESAVLRAFDLETGTALGELWTDDVDAYWLTDDRRSLITVHHRYNDENRVVATTIRCWDLPPAKPLRWVGGGMVALALLMLSFGCVWRRLRRRNAAAVAQQPAKP
jgi:hypothetical protein